MGQQMGTAHQPVQGIYFCPHNEKYICHLELSWQLRETKILVEIENDPKGWRTRALVFAAHTVIISDGWKQEGLELISQNETFPAKQGSSHHVRERIHHLLTENGFSFTESQTSCFITSGSSGSSWCKPEAALLWGWCVSSHIPRCRTLSFPHSCGKHNTDQPLAAGHESWMPSQSLRVAPTHSQGPEGRGDLCGDNVWGDREGTHGGEETLRIQRSLRRREQLQRAAAAQELSPSARHSTTSSGHLLEGTLALITKGNCSKETICSSQPQV